MPGGTTYGIGVRLPFSSMFTVPTSSVELSTGALIMAGSAITFAWLSSLLNERQSPRTSCNEAIRSTMVSAKPVIYMRMNLIDLKSWMPFTDCFDGLLIGMRNWYLVTLWVVPLGSLTCEVTLSLM